MVCVTDGSQRRFLNLNSPGGWGSPAAGPGSRAAPGPSAPVSPRAASRRLCCRSSRGSRGPAGGQINMWVGWRGGKVPNCCWDSPCGGWGREHRPGHLLSPPVDGREKFKVKAHRSGEPLRITLSSCVLQPNFTATPQLFSESNSWFSSGQVLFVPDVNT